ncbi:hypothetical protein [Lacticaseibacillus jixiensis]|uniref:hypothetical protein n=1 Tax=Lacticaseibacillus jixiensis TaxID=3231926 RepID=UPI0036F44A44
METFGGILALIAIVAFGVGLVGLIVALIRKSDKMPWLYTIASGAGVMTLAVVLVGLSQGSTENQDTATISSLKAVNSNLQDENSSLKQAGTNTPSIANDSSDDASTDVSTNTATTTKTTTTSDKSYTLNQKATVLDSANNPQVSLTVTSVTKSFNEWGRTLRDEGTLSIEISNEKTVQFTISYTNINAAESFLPSLYDIAVYDAAGTAAQIVDQQDGQTKVSKGHTASTTFWVNFNDNTPKGSKVELEYQTDEMNSPISFKLTVN